MQFAALARERPCLPLWGRWHGKAVTEEVLPQYEFAEIFQKTATLYRASPAPFGGTLPKGEGFDSAVRNCISQSAERIIATSRVGPMVCQ